MQTNELKHLLALTLIKGIGTLTTKNLVAYTGSAEAVFGEKKKTLAKIPGIGESIIQQIDYQSVEKRVEDEFTFMEKNQIKALSYLDENYPQRLKECNDGPIILFSGGTCDFNRPKTLAVVGTRNASHYGKSITRTIIEDLKQLAPDVLIVSGLAFGIDIAAHKAALDNGFDTVAVLAHGLDIIYPGTHLPVSQKIEKQGALLTEFLSGTNPDRQNFVKRNRIVAGMCDATLIVETGVKGGALITARLAASYNRDVLAVPGNVGQQFSQGCNLLIKEQTGCLVENGSDIMAAMNWTPINSRKIQPTLFPEFTSDEEKIVEILRKNNPGNLNSIALDTDFLPGKLSILLLNLEMKGIIVPLPGNFYKLMM